MAIRTSRFQRRWTSWRCVLSDLLQVYASAVINLRIRRRLHAVVRYTLAGFAFCLSESPALAAQDIVVDYVTTMMHKAMDESSKRGKLTTEDLVYLVRKVCSADCCSDGQQCSCCTFHTVPSIRNTCIARRSPAKTDGAMMQRAPQPPFMITCHILVCTAAAQDPRKYGRVKELLFMNEEIKKAKRAFEQDDELLPGEGAPAAAAAEDS